MLFNNRKVYRLLHRDPPGNNENGKNNPASPSPTPIIAILSLIITTLLCLNGLLLIHRVKSTNPPSCDCRSYYAGLKQNLPVPISHSTEYVSENLSAVAQLWEHLSGDPGVVALPQAYVSEKGLPHAMRFPWDDDKGVYLLQGFHNLHCLRTLFRYAWNAEHSLPQRIAFSHIQHCLDQLRQDVICNADDTPRYAGFQSPPGTGAGQVRLCRDWEELEKWARERTACFRHEDEVPGRMVDRFRFCPDRKVLWPTGGSD